MPRVPAILDTGHNHNFSIGQSQLGNWAGIQAKLLEPRGAIRERGQRISLHAATLWLHPNQAGKPEPQTDRNPLQLFLREGIAIYPDELAPRLPVLGLRALTSNRLCLTIDGNRQLVWLRTQDWRDRLFRLLG